MIAARLARIHVVRPLKAGPTGGPAATEPNRAADGQSGPDGIELLATSFSACPAHLDAAARAVAPSASAKLVSVVDPDDSSDDSHPERSVGPLARSPSSARQHQASTGGPASSGRAPRNSSSKPERTRRDLRRLQRLQRARRYR